MTSHKLGSNNGSVWDCELSLSIDIAADHWLTEVTLISLYRFSFLVMSHNVFINCTRLLSMGQASITV